MSEDKETPERRRERMRYEELKRNRTGNVGGAFDNGSNRLLADLIGSLGWKGTAVLIVVMIIGFIVVSYFVR